MGSQRAGHDRVTELNWKFLFRSFVNFFTDSFFLKIFYFQPSLYPCLYMCFSLTSQALPSIFSSIRIFSNELAFCIRWPKYQDWSFSISPSSKYSGLILCLIPVSELYSGLFLMKAKLLLASFHEPCFSCTSWVLLVHWPLLSPGFKVFTPLRESGMNIHGKANLGLVASSGRLNSLPPFE